MCIRDSPVSMYLNDIFTVPVNLSGLPAISIPAGKDKDKYPLGLQLIGKAFEEQNLLNISYSMEKELNFKNDFQDWWIKWVKIMDILSREAIQNMKL